MAASSSENSIPEPFLHTFTQPAFDEMLTSTLSISNSASAYPIAQRILPQLASSPNIAHLNSGERITLFATIMAVSRSAAPLHVHSISFDAPSPSFASIFVRFISTSYKAALKISKSSFSVVISLFPASPFAMILTISFVEVSPSTLKQLYVTLTISLNAF